jgi:predicted metalloprotease with PDZ domain
VLATPGRHHYSVAQASFDAWTRYYRPDENTANATVSYYTKGSLVALGLDLALRQLPAPGNAKRQPSLDGVMQALWKLGRPITQADITQALADEAGQAPAVVPTKAGASVLQAWQALLHDWTEGCNDLPLQTLLAQHGVIWHSKPGSLTQQWGLRVQDNNGTPKVQAVMRGSVAEQIGLSVGDELIALDGWRIKRAEDLAAWHNATRAQPLLVSRDQRILSLQTLTAQSASKVASKAASKAGTQDKAQALASAAAESVTLTLSDLAPEPAALVRRQGWLHA